MLSDSKQYDSLYWFLFIIGCVSSFLFFFCSVISYDELQILTKGVHLARHGILIPYGAVIQGGGHIPGILTTLFAGLPMGIVLSPFSIAAVILGLQILALHLYLKLTNEVFSNNLRLVIFFFFWLSAWRSANTILWNPSYLFFFSVLHMYSAYKIRNQSSFLYTFLHVISLGAALQLHASWVILALVSGFLFIRKLIKINWAGFSVASAIILMMLGPYFYEIYANSAMIDDLSLKNEGFIGRGIFLGQPLIKGIAYWFRYSSTYFFTGIFVDVSYQWLPAWMGSTIKAYLGICKWLLAALTIYFSIRSNFFTGKKIFKNFRGHSESTNPNADWLLTYTFITFASTVICLALSPIRMSHWHLIVIFPQALLPLLFFWNEHRSLYEKYFRNRYFVGFFVSTVFLVSFFGAMKSLSFDYQKNTYSEFHRLDKLGQFGPARNKL